MIRTTLTIALFSTMACISQTQGGEHLVDDNIDEKSLVTSQQQQVRNTTGNGAFFAGNGAFFGANGPMYGGNGAMFGGNGPLYAGNGAIVDYNGALWFANGALFTANGALYGGNGPLYAGNGAFFVANGPLYTGNGQLFSGGAIFGEDLAFSRAGGLRGVPSAQGSLAGDCMADMITYQSVFRPSTWGGVYPILRSLGYYMHRCATTGSSCSAVSLYVRKLATAIDNQVDEASEHPNLDHDKALLAAIGLASKMITVTGGQAPLTVTWSNGAVEDLRLVSISGGVVSNWSRFKSTAGVSIGDLMDSFAIASIALVNANFEVEIVMEQLYEAVPNLRFQNDANPLVEYYCSLSYNGSDYSIRGASSGSLVRPLTFLDNIDNYFIDEQNDGSVYLLSHGRGQNHSIPDLRIDAQTGKVHAVEANPETQAAGLNISKFKASCVAVAVRSTGTRVSQCLESNLTSSSNWNYINSLGGYGGY